MKVVQSFLAIALIALVVAPVSSQSKIGPDSRPCDAVGEPTGMESVVYKKGSGWEGYFVLTDDEGYVVTSSGYYRLLVNGNPLFQWRYIACSDFRAFETRGLGWRMGSLFFAQASQRPTVEFYTSKIICSGDGDRDSCTKR